MTARQLLHRRARVGQRQAGSKDAPSCDFELCDAVSAVIETLGERLSARGGQSETHRVAAVRDGEGHVGGSVRQRGETIAVNASERNRRRATWSARPRRRLCLRLCVSRTVRIGLGALPKRARGWQLVNTSRAESSATPWTLVRCSGMLPTPVISHLTRADFDNHVYEPAGAYEQSRELYGRVPVALCCGPS